MDKLNFANTNNSLKYNDDIWMTIKENGNIGIGNENPSYTLDVSGSVNASGNVKFGKISDLNGINSATPSKGEHLMWNDASGNWKPGMNTNWKKNNDSWYYDGSGVAIGRENLGGIKELTADNFNQIQKITTDVSGIATGIYYQKNNRIAFDGKYAIFGDPDNKSAHIYKYNGSNWEKQTTIAPGTGTDPLASKADNFGYSVDIHENFVIISDINYDSYLGYNQLKGAVFIYERVGENWEFRNWYWPNEHNGSSSPNWGTIVSIAKNDDYVYFLITAPNWKKLSGNSQNCGAIAIWYKHHIDIPWEINKGKYYYNESRTTIHDYYGSQYLTCSKNTYFNSGSGSYNTEFNVWTFGTQSAAIDKKTGSIAIGSSNFSGAHGNRTGGYVFCWTLNDNNSEPWAGKYINGRNPLPGAPGGHTNRMTDGHTHKMKGDKISFYLGTVSNNVWGVGWPGIQAPGGNGPNRNTALANSIRDNNGFGYNVSIYNNKILIGDYYGTVYYTDITQWNYISGIVGLSSSHTYLNNVKFKSGFTSFSDVTNFNTGLSNYIYSNPTDAYYSLNISKNNIIISSWNDASYNRIEIFKNTGIPSTSTKIGEITVTNTTKVEHVQLDDNYATIYIKDDDKIDIYNFPNSLFYNYAVEGNAHVENELHVGGNVGIGVAPTEYKLDVDGEAKTTSSWSTSDDRLKHNEQSLTTPLETIMKLEPKHYFKTKELYDISHNFTLDASGYPVDFSNNHLVEGKDYTRETGIIAQDIQKIPELAFSVRESDYGERPMAVNYNNIHCTHIAATKELNVKLESLSVKNTELKAKNSELKESLEQIKQHLAN